MDRTKEAESNGKNIVATVNAFDCLADETQQVQIVVENYEPVSMQTSDKVEVQQSQTKIPMKKQIDTMKYPLLLKRFRITNQLAAIYTAHMRIFRVSNQR